MRTLLPVIMVLLSPFAAMAQSCPAPLADARRLVLVTVADVNAPEATLRRFTRSTLQSPWVAEGGPMRALVGRNGVGWGVGFHAFARPGEAIKKEGDKRAPAGFFPIGRPFGFAAASRPDYLRLTPGTVCVDDPGHAAYNTITTRGKVGKARGENMATAPEYKHGLAVDYPTDRAARGGSCIFIHLWTAHKTGTAGCVALVEHDLADVQDFAAREALLAIVPAKAADRFRGCLPAF